ncbi:MAG TPA: hypothetical protein VGU68_21770 [Ktedonobacteraceae bacterium]|nr:hypothetical protein [Ktedonobacteraceae bacterium]
MTTVHLHLLLNHIPILGSIFITVLFIVALIYRNTFLQKVLLWSLVVVALFTAATYLTGNGAEQAVQGLPGVSEDILHLHESVAKVGLALMFVTGAIALAGALFYSFKPKLPRLLLVLVLSILLLNSGVFVYIGYLGGQIHHPEIRSSSSQSISHMY